MIQALPPGLALILLVVTLFVALMGVRLLAYAWADSVAMRRRTALDDVERRAGQLRGRLETRLRTTEVGRYLVERLTSAGISGRVVDFLLVAVALALLGFFIANLLLPWWLAVFVGMFSARGAWLWVERKREKRREQFIMQLADIARVLSNASSAGLGLRTAIEMAARELDDPAASEMGLIHEELVIGQTTEGALENLARRMPSRDVAVLVSTLLIQQRAGGDLVRALQDMAATLDERRDLRREVKTLMSGSVFTGYLVAAMGVGAVLMLNAINPGVIDRMAETGVGQILIVASATFYAVGFLLVRQITRIDL